MLAPAVISLAGTVSPATACTSARIVVLSIRSILHCAQEMGGRLS